MDNNTPTQPSIPEPQPNMANEQKPPGNHKKTIIIVSLFIFAIILVIAGIFYLFTNRSTTPSSGTSTPTPTTSQADSFSLPKAKFNSYTFPQTIPVHPEPLYEYTLKSDFSENEAQLIANKFSLSTYEMDQETMVFSEMNNPETRGNLTFDTASGMFAYNAYSNNIKISGDIRTGARNFLQTLGYSDDAIECNITYQIQDFPEATYVECHRSWDKLGSPLVNISGLMNLSEDTKVSSLKVGYTDPAWLDDPSIVNVSTGQNGKVRPNDFNTATFLISNDGSLVSLNSTLRFITGKKEVNPLPYENALISFSKNNNVESFIIPSGGGQFDMKKVFPNNIAESQQAYVNDFEIVYVENLKTSSQKTYSPMYLIRGTAQLINGYSVKYVQTTSATQDTESVAINSFTNGSESTKPLQIGTFYPTVIPTKTPAPEVTTAPPADDPRAPSVGINADCRAGADFWNTPTYDFTLPDGGRITLINPGIGATNTLYVKSASGTDTRINSLRQQFIKLIEDQYVFNYNARRSDPGFRTVSEFGGLAGFYDNVTLQTSDNYLPPQKFLVSKFPLVQQFMKNVETRTMAIDSGGSPGSNPSLTFFPLYLTLVGIGQDGNEGGASSCYLSGGSPAIFLYSKSNSLYSVSITKNVTYADPAFINSWNVKSNSNGNITVNNKVRPFLYYEFDKSKTDLTHGKYGYIIKRENISSLVKLISNQLKLTGRESSQLENEFNNALLDIDRTNSLVKITLINEIELNQKLPLNISPNLTEKRFHFLLSGTENNEQIIAPKLLPIIRSAELMVELGASTR